MTEYYAHSDPTHRLPEQGGRWHPLADHLRDVAAGARKLAHDAKPGDERFSESAYWAGLLHDVGKYTDAFQAMMRAVAAGRPQQQVEHSGHGAALAAAFGAHEIAFAVAGHHAGLPDLDHVKALLDREERQAAGAVKVIERARQIVSSPDRGGQVLKMGAVWPEAPKTTESDRLALDLRIRILFSCLIDADRLDTERFQEPERFEIRQRAWAHDQPGQRLDRLRAYLQTIRLAAPQTAVNLCRNEVLEACLWASGEAPGLFSLTVPTGGGKTLAAMAFALAHAKTHDLRRVIVVIPYLSIIEQNASVYRVALGHEEEDGKRVVLEHHSAVEEAFAGRADDESSERQQVARRLAAENWDAPVVVTTSVQFFESLFSNRPSSCRKLHRIARSVVIFDEVQTFPPDLLRPILSMMEALSREYRVSAVFCTATQPAFEQRHAPGWEAGVSDGRWNPGTLREISPEPARLFRALRRAVVRWPQDDRPMTWREVAARMAERRTALCIVNTKDQARLLFSHLWRAAKDAALPDEALIHLSSHMCPQHRMDVLGEGATPGETTIKGRLDANKPCLVVSTQLVEAGVDLDFPLVLRAFGPLDAVAQAAGRCNREGRGEQGAVVVFRTEDGKLPPDAYKQATEITDQLLAARGSLDIHDPTIFNAYFDILYGSRELDARQIQALRHGLSFPLVSERFRIIDERSHPVLVPYGDGKDLIEELRRTGRPTRELTRALQRYLVGLPPWEWTRGLGQGLIREVVPGTAEFIGTYDERLGVCLEPVDPMALVVAG